MQNFLKKNITLIVIIAIALALRFLFILKSGNYWDDEMFSVVYSQKPWIDSLTKFWVWETNPPLHMFLLKLWFYIFPVTEFFARMPSVIFGVLSCLAIYNFANRIFSNRIAILATLILATSSELVFYSVTARAYVLLILLTILSCDYFFRLFIEKQYTLKNKIIYGLLTLLILYNHLTALEVFFSQFVVLLAVNRSVIKQWFYINLLPGILWLFWAIFSLAYKMNPLFVNGAWFLNISNENNVIIRTLKLIFIGPVNNYYSIGVIILFFLALIILWYKQRKINKIDNNLFVVFILAILPIIIFLLMHLYNIRFILISLPWIALIGAYLINHYLKNKIIQYIFILLLLIPGIINIYTVLPVNDWTSASNIISQKINPAKKQIIINSFFFQKDTVDKYIDVNIPQKTYLPPGAETIWDYYLITKNYVYNPQPTTTVNLWLKENNLNDYNEIFLLDMPGRSEHLIAGLQQNGWKKVGTAIRLKTTAEQYLVILEK